MPDTGHVRRGPARQSTAAATEASARIEALPLMISGLPEQWASFAGSVPTTGVHTVCRYSVCATVMHQCYAFDLEPVAQVEQFDAFSFR